MNGEKVATQSQSNQTRYVYHYTNNIGQAGINQSGVILPSPDGFVYVTPDLYPNGQTAQAQLALSNTPTGYYEIPVSQIQNSMSAASMVPPANGQPGAA